MAYFFRYNFRGYAPQQYNQIIQYKRPWRQILCACEQRYESDEKQGEISSRSAQFIIYELWSCHTYYYNFSLHNLIELINQLTPMAKLKDRDEEYK